MTSNSKELIDLAERCEKATGPDSELDLLIRDTVFQPCINPGAEYTASLDAAMTLVPKGWALSLRETTDGDRRDHSGDPLAAWTAALIEHKNTGYKVDQRGCWRRGFAATPALALCAAALRARATQSVDEGGR